MVNFEELRKHLFIVIGEEHYTPLGAIRSLGEEGIYPVVIVLKPQAKHIANVASSSKYISKLHQVDSYSEVFDLLMTKYSNINPKSFIIPCDDIIVAALDQHYNTLKDYFYIGNAGENNRISYYEQKQVLNALAIKHGFRVARTWKVENKIIPDDVIYPVITKPFESYEGWKQDYYICKNHTELEEALNKVHNKVFLQQYINKTNELCLDGIVVNKGRDVFISIASTYTYILPDYYSMEMAVKNFTDKNLLKSFSAIFSEIGYEGIFSSEFMVDKDNDLWFLEINFRNSTWSYASTSVNMNLPCIWAYGMLQGQLPENIYKTIPNNYIALAEVTDFEKRVREYRLISVREWIKHVRAANCLYFYNKRDKKPAMLVWKKKVKNIISKKIFRRN